MSGPRDLASEHDLLSESGIFDEAGYLARAGEEARPDPIGHYLETGWRLGLEPNDSFPGSLLQPYFATLAASQPPAITWLVLRSAGWPMHCTREAIEQAATAVRICGLFDESFYRAQLGASPEGLDPATHYVTVGERMGLAPSPEFDPAYYAARNPDVRDAGVNYLLHFAHFGRLEGRLPKAADVRTIGRAVFDPAKESVLLVVHETSRTGAPILGWNLGVHLAQRYNLFTVRMGDGDLTDDFEAFSVEVYGPFPWVRRNETDVESSLRGLLEARKYRYAIVNSAESRLVIEPCTRRFIATVFVIHEFATYMSPASALCSALDWSSEIVFSARMTAQSSEEVHPNLLSRAVHVMPQGVTALPASALLVPPVDKASSTEDEDDVPAGEDDSSSIVEHLTSIHDLDGTFIVLGAGFVHIRKGVDLFLATAAAVIRRHPSRSIHFLWVGDGYRPQKDFDYSVYLYEQLNRSGLTEHVTFLDAVSDLEPIYRIADAFLLTSRLDPLPNVTIDAAVRGIPVVCFAEASGMADLMSGNPATAFGVVDYLDADAAGRKIINLAEDADLKKRTAAAMLELAHANFDMAKYVEHLDALGTAAALRMTQRSADSETLRNDRTFDQEMFLGPRQLVETREATIVRYLTIGAARGWSTLRAKDHRFRRPSPGFNPRIYAAAHASRLAGGIDPLADFVRRGKPVGPWQTNVLRPDDPVDRVVPRTRLRAVLHAHFHYPELCSDFLAHLAANQTHCDLLVSTHDPLKAERLQRSLTGYTRGKVDIRVVPNKGRDIGPLLTAFADDLGEYDLVGHVHAKRSRYKVDQALKATWGDGWREFLWQNLIGGLHPMMDRIVGAFEQQDSLGLVFPSDPNFVDWGDNRDQAAELAARMGWKGKLPDHFDFPLGTMFWIRREALQPLLDLRLGWNEYPEEPVPYDGTLLHALERLPTIACQLAGFTQAVTHVSGVSWAPPGV